MAENINYGELSEAINDKMDRDLNNRSDDSGLRKLVERNGWICVRACGSHYIYEKEGVRYTVPFHGSKEVGKGLEKKIKKEMGLK